MHSNCRASASPAFSHNVKSPGFPPLTSMANSFSSPGASESATVAPLENFSVFSIFSPLSLRARNRNAFVSPSATDQSCSS